MSGRSRRQFELMLPTTKNPDDPSSGGQLELCVLVASTGHCVRPQPNQAPPHQFMEFYVLWNFRFFLRVRSDVYLIELIRRKPGAGPNIPRPLLFVAEWGECSCAESHGPVLLAWVYPKPTYQRFVCKLSLSGQGDLLLL